MNNENNKYAAIDTTIIDNISNNSNFNIQNLMKLSKDTELYIFNKKYKKWSLKSKEKLIKECESIKKKELPIHIYSDSQYVVKAINEGWLNNWIKNNFKGLETVMSSFSNVISLKSFSSITSNNFALFTKGSFIWLNDFGNEVFKIDLPSTNFSEIDVKVSSNGKMYIVFLDTIENSIYIYDKSKNQFFEKQYEGSEFVYLEEIDNHFFVITKKSNMLIMHKIN
jgi:hypothetical protein